jgi:hypothetical protein
MDATEQSVNGDPAASAEGLVIDAFKLRRRMAADAERLEAIEQQIIALGAGDYAGGGDSLKVIGAVAGAPGMVFYVLDGQDEEEAKKLAGEAFADLFLRKITFSPCEGFALVLPKLVTPAKARKLELLCKRVGKAASGKRAYVRYR